MSTFELHAEVDPVSLVQLSRLQNYQAAFKTHVLKGLWRSVEVLETTAVGYMWDHFQNPTGQLENAFTWGILDWNRVYLDNTQPYARRRNWGFSGMTDSLGRTYLDDPGIYWAENSIETVSSEVEDIFQEEMQDAINGIAAY